ncbi:MAG: ribulose-phosphate 3-epimerase [Clostridia bacterium]|nr:ribulose-phosphate 3-epimerase [Clostridia bacterium]
MVEIAPSLLSADFSRLEQEIGDIEQLGIKMLHLDVMDGHFVPNITFGPGLINSLRPLSKMIFDVHLMIEQPERYVVDFVKAGADIVTVHVEAAVHLHRLLALIKEQGVKAAVALNPATPLSSIEWILPQLDMVLLMSVNPGFGGQAFIPEAVAKIRALKTMMKEQGIEIPIQVDGGINRDTAPLVVEAGAEILVAGSAVFGQRDRGDAIRQILKGVAMVRE